MDRILAQSRKVSCILTFTLDPQDHHYVGPFDGFFNSRFDDKSVVDDILKVGRNKRCRTSYTDICSKLGEQVKKQDEALSGVVTGDAAGDRSGVRKSANGDSRNGSNGPPLLDTAFMKVDDTDDRRMTRN